MTPRRCRRPRCGCCSQVSSARCCSMRTTLHSGACRWRSALRLRTRSLRIGAALLLTVAVLVGFHTLNGIEAGSSLLVAMATLKLTETVRRRDWLIVLGAALFLLLAACLDAQALWRLPLYAAELWLLCTALYALGAGAEAPPVTTLLRRAALSLAI